MNQKTATLMSSCADESGPPTQPPEARNPSDAAKATLWRIYQWCIAPPRLKSYSRPQFTGESSVARAARIRRTQAAVDELFGKPDPEEACFRRFWDPGV